MIAEPGILSTSPWNSDFLLKDLQSDFYKSYLNVTDGLDIGFPSLEVESERMRNTHVDIQTGFNSSCSPSSASSDCSEELSFDYVWQDNNDNNTLHIPDHDYLNTSLNLLDDSGVTVCPEEFDWIVGDSFVVPSSLLNEDTCCDDIPSIPSSPVPKTKCSRSTDPVADTKLWSRMRLEERLEAVECLTNIISNQMGLREQLDIIRIIEPSAVISPTDTEFVIDLNSLNDDKLSSIREYVRKDQVSQRGKSENKVSSGKTSFSPVNVNSTNNSASKHDASASPAKGKSLKKEAKEKRAPQKVFRQRQKKEYRQLMKERRSGLFQREEVLSLSTFPVIEEDLDIDILG